MKNDETYEFEDHVYIKPGLSRDEQLTFVDNLRGMQSENNQQIETQTRNLGTDIALNQGGLTSYGPSGESYFQKRYQTPQVNSQVATLKATAQASALNDVLSNLQAQYKKRYNDTYAAAQKRARKAATTSGTGGVSPTTTSPATEGDVSTTPSQSTAIPTTEFILSQPINSQYNHNEIFGVQTDIFVEPSGNTLVVESSTGKVLRRNDDLTEYGVELATKAGHAPK